VTLRTRTLLAVTSLLAVAVLITTGVLGWSSRRALLDETEAHGQAIARLLAQSAAFGTQVMEDVEAAIGEQMLIEATIAAHLVAVAEAAGLPPAEINGRLDAIVENTALDEFWITDETGRKVLGTEDMDFTFSPDSAEQPQAHVFHRLLTGEAHSVIQQATKREVDTQVFKYAGVAGVDMPRIVQVGYHANFLEELRGRVGLPRLMQQVLASGSVLAIHVLDRNLETVEYAGRDQFAELAGLSDADLARLAELAAGGGPTSVVEPAVLKVMTPIGDDSGELAGGAIVVSLPTDHVQATIRRQVRLAALLSFAVLLVGSGVSVVGANAIAGPITRLTRMSRRIAEGDLTQRIETSAGGEIGSLAASFNEMARRLSESIEELKTTTAVKERIERELEIARDIQKSMVPKTFPAFPERSEFDIFATLVPAREVGGDFYDFFYFDDDHICVAIGDVSGKGVPAALFMAVSRTLHRVIASETADPGEILSRLNRDLCRDNDACMFVTLFCGVLDIRTGRLHYSNGGHDLPLLVGAGGVRPIEKAGGPALGLLDTVTYTSGSVDLLPGDRLFLFTDGVTEAEDTEGDFFGSNRIETFLATRAEPTLEETVEHLVEEVGLFAAGAPQSDDITILALEYVGSQG